MERTNAEPDGGVDKEVPMMLKRFCSIWAEHKSYPSAAGLVLLILLVCAAAVTAKEQTAPRTGQEIYLSSCVVCHGVDGRGSTQSMVGFDNPLPDFTDSSFISREPRQDWVTIARMGGPVRAFSTIMPSFKGLLTIEETHRVVDYLHTFNRDDRWPAGELNLPRPLVTGKAYPEDEAVFEAAGDLEGPGAVSSKFTYEKRVGPRSQVELVVPYGWNNGGSQDLQQGWYSGLGDIVLAAKRAMYHSGKRGTIFSAAAEFILPTGDERRGFGKGTVVFEPNLTFGQIFAADFFLQSQAGMEIPFDSEKGAVEAFFRVALGRSFNFSEGGRTFSPMVEILAGKELEEGAAVSWDILPQMQVTLSKRQHIRLNFGVLFPLTEASTRSTQFLVYLLWDWFDGGFFEGW